MAVEGVRKVPQLPELDVLQRRAGYDRSLQLRRARAQAKAGLGRRELLLADALELDEVQGMKVRDLLRALPKVGQKKADRLMQAAGINPARTVGQLGSLQKLSLLKQATASKLI